MHKVGDAWSGGSGSTARNHALAADVVTFPIQAPFLAALAIVATPEALRNASNDKAWENRKEEVFSRLRADPAIAIREKWHEEMYDVRCIVLYSAFFDSSVPFTAKQLETFYDLLPPQNRLLIFAHSNCSKEFIAAHIMEISSSSNAKLLSALISNPNTPIEFLEEIAHGNQGSRVGQLEAREALYKRLRLP